MFKVGDKSKSVTAGKRLRSCGIVSYCVSEPRTIVRKSERNEEEGFAQRVFQSFLHSSAITSGISSGKKRFAVSKRRTPFDPGRVLSSHSAHSTPKKRSFKAQTRHFVKFNLF